MGFLDELRGYIKNNGGQDSFAMGAVNSMQSWAESNYKKQTGRSYKSDLRDFIWEYERLSDSELDREEDRIRDSGSHAQKPVKLEAIRIVRKERRIS